MSTSRYLGKKMSRSVSSPGLVAEREQMYMTVREGKKVFRVPVQVVKNTRGGTSISRARGKSVDQLDDEPIALDMFEKKKAMESGDGNWVMKTEGYLHEENKGSKSLRLRNNAVSQMFEAELQRQEAGKRRNEKDFRGETQSTIQPRSPRREEVVVMKSTQQGPIYVRRSGGGRGGRGGAAAAVTSKAGATNADGSASVYVTYPVSAYATMPRQRVQSESRPQLKTAMYQAPPAQRSISAPVYQAASGVYYTRDTPSPTPTITKFLAEDDHSLSSGSRGGFDMKTQGYQQPLQINNATQSLHRVYMKKSDSNKSGARVLVGKNDAQSKGASVMVRNDRNVIYRSNSHPDLLDDNSPTPMLLKPVEMNRSYSHESTDLGYQTVPRNMKPNSYGNEIYRGEVVRIQVPNYKANEKEEEIEVPHNYKTYPEVAVKSEVVFRKRSQDMNTLASDESGKRKPTATIDIKADMENDQVVSDVNANHIKEITPRFVHVVCLYFYGLQKNSCILEVIEYYHES